MAYTDVWDVTAPLDTQAANQGAVDFRATKLDIMQRVASFGAGTLAARPTPETTGASADWTGVMYWATDTKQTFRWNGTAWVDISSLIPSNGISLIDMTVYTRPSPNVIGSGELESSVTFAAGAVAVGDVFNVVVRFSVTNASPSNATGNIQFETNGVNIFNIASIADVTQTYSFEAQVTVVDATHLRGTVKFYTAGVLTSLTFVDLVVASVLAGGLSFFITKNITGTVGHTNNNTYVFDYLTASKN